MVFNSVSLYMGVMGGAEAGGRGYRLGSLGRSLVEAAILLSHRDCCSQW